jgi:hypothetical protein
VTVQLRYPFNALVSYHYYRRDDLSKLTAAGLRLVGDSGAFSARQVGVSVDLGEFADWCHRWQRHLVWIASLDVLNQPEVSWRNYRTLRDKHGLDVIPTIHGGDDSHTWIRRYAEDGVDFMGLGGLVSQRARPLAVLPWLADLMRYAREHHPQMRFHGWGCTNPVLLRVLPYYSVDSSSLGASYRYARLTLFDPRTAEWARIVLDGRDPHRYHDMLTRYYGVTARQVLHSTVGNRTLLVRLGGRSYQYAEDYLRKRHGQVSAPRYGINADAPGPHVHGTDGSFTHLTRLGRNADELPAGR